MLEAHAVPMLCLLSARQTLKCVTADGGGTRSPDADQHAGMSLQSSSRTAVHFGKGAAVQGSLSGATSLAIVGGLLFRYISRHNLWQHLLIMRY